MPKGRPAKYSKPQNIVEIGIKNNNMKNNPMNCI
jgi:hypothetical protein